MAEGLRYKDKVTLITGGSSGIGKGCAKVFAQQGSNVVICSNNDDEGATAEKELNSIGKGKAKFVFADVTKEDDIKKLIETVVKEYGQIDCVINNAGWHCPYGTIDEYTTDQFRNLFELNVLGYFTVSKYALPYLRKTQGSIINNASMEGNIASAYSSIYSATKGAVIAFTKSLAIEEAKYNVRVNSISPGSIFTPLAEEFINKSPDPERTTNEMRNISVLGRSGTPEECGLTCLYLAADATFCTGIDIHVSGGCELNYGIKNIHDKRSWPTSFTD